MVNGEKFQSHAVTLTLISNDQCRNSLQYVQDSSGLNHYFLSYCAHTNTHTHTDRHTDGHEYSIVAVDKTQLQLEKVF